MPNFLNIDYLKNGNSRQKEAYRSLTESQIFEKLNNFDPILTGTIPIQIDILESDLDVICYWKNKIEFSDAVKNLFSNEKEFQLKELLINGQETVISNFIIDSFEIEIFGQNQPTTSQNAYRHLIIEHHILHERGEKFKQEVISLKRQGFKTEPAFAKILGLKGDPYISLLNYKANN